MSASDKEGIQQGIQVNLLFFDVIWRLSIKKGEGVSKTVRIITNQNFV